MCPPFSTILNSLSSLCVISMTVPGTGGRAPSSCADCGTPTTQVSHGSLRPAGSEKFWSQTQARSPEEGRESERCC